MNIGVPKEIKDQEFRVGLSPSSVRELVAKRHQVFVETGAGIGAGFPDAEYEAAGAVIVLSSEKAWDQELVVKVKEPLQPEYDALRSGQLLFTYLHLAANRNLTEALISSGITAIAYELVEQDYKTHRSFPLLIPMSIIAGRLAVQVGAHYLERHSGGKGVLLSGVPGVRSGHVVILGGGVVGTEAARMAMGLGARVTLLDVNVERLGELERILGDRVELLYSTAQSIANTVSQADLLVGAVLIPGQRAPTLVSRSLVEAMPDGAVIVDVAVDQGGCIETLHPTSHSNPTYVDCGVVHYGVPNMPGAVPWTATQALNNSTLPYVLALAERGLKALDDRPDLAKGLSVRAHRLVHVDLCHAFPDLAESNV